MKTLPWKKTGLVALVAIGLIVAGSSQAAPPTGGIDPVHGPNVMIASVDQIAGPPSQATILDKIDKLQGGAVMDVPLVKIDDQQDAVMSAQYLATPNREGGISVPWPQSATVAVVCEQIAGTRMEPAVEPSGSWGGAVIGPPTIAINQVAHGKSYRAYDQFIS